MRGRFGGSSADLTEVRQRLWAWRQVHGGRGRRLPEDAWEAAVRLARMGDQGAVARALRLNPDSLTRRMTSAGDGGAITTRRHPAFVEVVPPTAVPGATSGCRVEFSGAGGTRLSIHFADAATVDFARLAADLMRTAR